MCHPAADTRAARTNGSGPLRWDIRTKVVALATACVAATGVTVGGVSAWQSSAFADDARTDVEDLVAADLTRTASGVYDVVATQGASTAAKVDSDLAVAQHVLAQAGGFRLDRGTVTWQARNQLSGEVTPVELPRAAVGGTWLGQNTDPGVPTPVVDQVRDLVGGTATVFQRTGPAGDMLRVATNVVGTTGSRAIGTHIPATNPDGAPNPVSPPSSPGRPTAATPSSSTPGTSRPTRRCSTAPAR